MANYDLTYEGSRVQGILDTGDELRDAGYIFRGEATPSTVPGTPTERVAYIGGPGTYTNFGSSITVGAGCICVFKYTGSAWSNQVINTGLSDAISSEATARSQADTALQNAINAINNNIGNGYVYAGVATPSTSPVTGKVFYLAVQAGTYTNFGNAVVTAGLNVIKYNGSAWSVDQVIAIDAEPTQGSDHLVKSGGVLNSIIQNGPAFDLSAYNAEGGVLATYADLSAALTALNALPADFKKGGMSIKFVLSSDNKYVQWRLMNNDWSTTVSDWQGVDDMPTEGSNNIVKSGGVYETFDEISLITSLNNVKSGAMASANWEADLVCYLQQGKSYTLYKLDTNGYPVNVGARIKLNSVDGTTIETLKSDYNGFFGFSFTPNISSNGEYKLHLGFTSAKSSDYYEQFMLVEGNVTIVYTQQYPYEEWNPKRSIILPDNSIGSQQLKDNIVSSQKISNNAIITSKIADHNITPAKLSSEVGDVFSPNYVKSGSMASANWEADLVCYLQQGKSYTLYKLDSNGYPVNVGARIKLNNIDGSTIETLKSDYNGFFGFTFIPNISSDGDYKLHLEFTSAKTADYYERFMLIDKSVTIIYTLSYKYYDSEVNFAATMALTLPKESIDIDLFSNTTKDFLFGITNNKVHLSFGDSITEQSLWQNKFKNYANTLSEIIKGYSGQALWSNCKASVLQDKLGSETFDIITIMFGTNDWGQSRDIGTIADTNPDGEYTGTFYGSLNTMLDNVTTLFNNKIIVVVTPPYGSEDYDYNMQPFSDNGEKNLIGKTIRDYADAIVLACKKWNVPCFDFNAVCGWNKNNRSVYLTADANGTYIHPNNTGATEYARKLAFYCKSL
jgi:lysophospholipase L1-like esterase